jgi:hypothetical protein
MKREIKFRAWNEKEKEMLYFDLFGTDEGFYIGIEGSRMIDKFHIMQCTGLKDKNGKEWYEGDIVRVNQRAPSHETIWDDNQMAWKIRCINNDSIFNINAPLFEIIGNLHEQPELINQKK